jgi:hypothetical protein
MQLTKTYKLRHATKQRQRWEAAAVLKGKDLARWMRETCDRGADEDLSAPADDQPPSA